MYGYEKPKRQPYETEESVKQDYRNFYWRLLFILMIPACILGSLFMMPVILMSHVAQTKLESDPNECLVSNQGRIVRIRTMLSSKGAVRLVYQWSGEHEDRWQIIMVEDANFPREASSSALQALCNQIVFGKTYTLVINGKNIVIVSDDGIMGHATACEESGTQELNFLDENSTDSHFVFNVLCNDKTKTQLAFTLGTGDK